MSKKVLVDMETGTILKELKEGDKIVSKDQSEAYKQRLDYMSRENNGHWVACHHDSINKVIQDISLIHAGAIMKLLPYMRFNKKGLLMNNNIPLNASDIESILERTRNVTSKILKELIEHKIINVKKQGRKNTYYINEKFHTLGIMKKHSSFTKVFIEKLKEVSEKLNLNELGLLYKILPFFHYEKYCLCENPDETNLDDIVYLTRATLSEKVNYSYDKLGILIKKLTVYGLMLNISSQRKSQYIIHPDLCYRKQNDSDHYAFTIELFNSFSKMKQK